MKFNRRLAGKDASLAGITPPLSVLAA